MQRSPHLRSGVAIAIAVAAATDHARGVAIAAAVGLGIATVATLVRHLHAPDAAALTAPAHVRELASALDLLAAIADRGVEYPAGMPFAADAPAVHVAETSLGLRVSCGAIHDPSRHLRHYAISSRPRELSDGAATRLSRIVMALEEHERIEIVRRAGVVHMLAGPHDDRR
jgi:hypothetical protein